MQFWQFTGFMPTEQVLPLAQASERLGFEGLAIPDHLFYARELHSPYPYTPDGRRAWGSEAHWPDPWALASAIGAATTSLRCMSAVYIAPARDLFTVAKLISTAAVLTEGRVVAGFGAGWCGDEFEQTGQAFVGRGRRLGEMVEVLRRLWGGDWTEHSGRDFDFPALSIAPVPAQPIPIYLGGRSDVAMRRAASIADGWIGGSYAASEVPPVIERLRGFLDEAERSADDFNINAQLSETPTVEVLAELADLGLSGIRIAAWEPAGTESGVEAKIEASNRFADEVIGPLNGRAG